MGAECTLETRPIIQFLAASFMVRKNRMTNLRSQTIAKKTSQDLRYNYEARTKTLAKNRFSMSLWRSQCPHSKMTYKPTGTKGSPSSRGGSLPWYLIPGTVQCLLSVPDDVLGFQLLYDISCVHVAPRLPRVSYRTVVPLMGNTETSANTTLPGT